MFTGLIEKTGTVKKIDLTSLGGKLTFVCDFLNPETVKTGDSIAVNGVCLTVVSINGNQYTVEIMQETLNLTNLKLLKTGDTVNTERAMSANSRLDGHIVQGHIDTTAKVKSIITDGFSKKISFSCNTGLVIYKGSIAVNGVSLTVSDVKEDCLEVSLIPETIKNTNLNSLRVGNIVNIEYDVVGKYIKKFVENSKKAAPKTKITEEFLKENGF